MAIQKIYVSEAVSLPKEMFYWDRNRSLAIGIGAGIGAAASAGASQSEQATAMGVGGGIGHAVGAKLAVAPSQQIVETMSANGIDVGKLVREKFVDELRASKKMVVVEAPELADGVMAIEVQGYGFGQTQGFSSVLHPTLNVQASILDNSNRTVWKQRDYITPLSKKNTVAHTFEQYVGEPEKLREAFSVAGKAVAEWLIEKLPAN